MTVNKIGKICVLIVFWIVLPLLVLEVGVRIIGGLFLTIQGIQNRQDLFRRDNYRILCLGDSLTRRQWPQPLEKELNKKDIGIKFKVIDEGRPGCLSSWILFKLESHITEYNPDMVIIMTGNAENDLKWENPLEQENNLSEKFDYDYLKQLFENNLPKDYQLFQNYHALIVINQKQGKNSSMGIIQ